MKTKLFVAALAALVITPAASFGDVITYTVDPARSSIALSGNYGGSLISGSLVDAFAGTIVAGRDFAENTLQLTGGTITAQAQNLATLVSDLYTGADYGFAAPANIGPNGASGIGDGIGNTGFGGPQAYFGSLHGAISDFAFSLSTPVIQGPESFGADRIGVVVISGDLGFDSTPVSLPGSVSLPDSFVLGPGTAGVADSAGGETLSIPFESRYGAQIDGQPLNLDFSGVLVATAGVSPSPEPATLSLFGAAAIMAALGRRRPAQ